MNPSIKVNNLSKRFYIGARAAESENLGEYLGRTIKAPFRKTRQILSGHASAAADLNEDFWALRDVSFEVQPGETVGIIGRNGAGKSTLLKVLTRITEPTGGYADIYGRVGSLLEVGTGFHPELTGRDNIFLNGAILGMSKVEIRSKFDEIVDFSGVEKFIDTPVKHYSSGMYVRLAFSVAAHLEPEILFIDEVLAVGDSRFQKKCINKMDEVSTRGRTILFVSHQMASITRLCNRAILLKDGMVVKDGPSQDVVGAYMSTDGAVMGCREYNDPDKRPGGEAAQLLAVRILDETGKVCSSIDIRSSVVIEMEFEVTTGGYILLPHFSCFNEAGAHLFVSIDRDETWRQRKRPKGIYKSRVEIPGNFFAECTVFVNANLTTLDPNIKQFIARDAVAFQVFDSLDGDSARGDYFGDIPGVVRPAFNWTSDYNLS
ncbi:MAG: polysaccharide ABC transporter ATP-binding protein [Desulforhopalus sp.]